jgi:hypothetical protein
MSETPEQIQEKIDALEVELAAAAEAEAAALQTQVNDEAELAALEAEEAAAGSPRILAGGFVVTEAEQAAVKAAAPKPSLVKRIMPTGQFQTPQQGTDSK